MQGIRTESEAVQSFAYEVKENSAVIWRCFSRDTKVEIPAFLEGYRVSEIAPYAFSAHMDERQLQRGIASGRIKIYVPQGMMGSVQEDVPALCGEKLEEIVLSPFVRRVGRYCFYNCGKLNYLEFSGELFDWGSGVFTGCHQMNRICVHAASDGSSSLKQVLDEVPEALQVSYFLEDDSACAVLMFPEFYEEGVENTPARILETHVHGSGMRYRNCFQNRKFDFGQYDVLFPHAKAQEPEELVARMVLGRLRSPYELSEKAKKEYESYTAEHSREFSRLLLLDHDLAGVEWLLALTQGKNETLVDEMIEYAAKHQMAEEMSYLMDYRRSHTKVVRRRFEL